MENESQNAYKLSKNTYTVQSNLTMWSPLLSSHLY